MMQFKLISTWCGVCIKVILSYSFVCLFFIHFCVWILSRSASFVENTIFTLFNIFVKISCPYMHGSLIVISVLFVCLYTNTTLSLLLFLYDRFWNQAMLVIRLCSFSELFWLGPLHFIPYELYNQHVKFY